MALEASITLRGVVFVILYFHTSNTASLWPVHIYMGSTNNVLKCQPSLFRFMVSLLYLIKDVKKKVEANHNMKFLLF